MTLFMCDTVNIFLCILADINDNVSYRMRKYVYGAYASAFGCNLDEMEKKMDDYPSLAAFFARHLKDGARPIDPRGGDLVSTYGIISDNISYACLSDLLPLFFWSGA
jgi:hypothetical protein